MSTSSLAVKKAYFAKVRQSNYIASLRLEGLDVTQAEIKRLDRLAFNAYNQRTNRHNRELI
ncbi:MULTISPECIES: YhfG family protein [Pseudomonadaceae]|uniref:DUF2559 domain-containing protein n=1 Tax=Metapseudomonas otitidis TaxID=319939 RepID=A0A679GMT9_9GAMM|nr:MULTISPECIES: YhfG family protein [Pseudomonas]MDU9399849.1 DUF2559 family protein [Pseudomonas sp. zfem003]BCA30805.1 hypothetical protein PtoMrB4_47820 [Pseudomonas otitidis]